MSPDETGFLESITDSPTDEAARFIYADWLEDRHDPRPRLPDRRLTFCVPYGGWPPNGIGSIRHG